MENRIGGEGPDAGLVENPQSVTPCPQGQELCDGTCVDVSANVLHCGMCSQACSAEDYCASGVCTKLCPTGELDCSGTCTAVASDPTQCGACGRACAPGEFCNGGVCDTTCLYEVCETTSGLQCADTSVSARHCGACGAACPSGESCVEGSCERVCPDGFGQCGNACVGLATDASHCGRCDNSCPTGVACIAGACGCPSGQALCGGVCVDTVANPEHCGTCGNSCGGGSTCTSGECVCPSGQRSCGDACSDVASDPQNCGACGTRCGTTEICSSGQCVPATVGCSPGLLLCGTSCVDTSSSASHCGQCDRACPAAQSCVSGTCACPGGGTLCDNGCVDTNTSNTHCGACGASCTAGRSCTAGSCQCPAGQAFCNGACVDTTSNDTHCGACGNSCGATRTCVSGSCECPSGAAFCGGACIDPLSNSEHCGSCGNPCAGGALCTGGNCVCPANQTACSGQCIDTQTNLSHCGSCGQQCAAGEVCSAGRCQGPVGADGCGTAARALTLTQVAAYQTVKIPIMTGGQGVSAANRVADVVQGRETMFRVFVNVDAGFTARELSARLTLTNGGAEDQYFEKRVISGNSTDASLASTFQIFVPPDKITQDTRYSVEVVECGTASGTLRTPRFPASSDVELSARRTGPVRIRIVPVQTNSRLPDTSESALSVYREYLRAMFPVTNVELSVTSQITTAYPINWTNLLVQVRDKRQGDAPPSDVYYYGFVKPTDTINQYCGGGCTAGIGYVGGATQAQSRASVGLAYANQSSAVTMAHELGHNHGRNHAPCAPGTISGVDTNYPHAGARLGVWGYDARTRVLLNPDQHTDIMGYCNSKWISDYTYRGLATRVMALNGSSFQISATGPVARYRMVLLDRDGPRWGLPYRSPDEPFGVPEQADIVDVDSNVVARVTVYRSEIADIDSATVLVPEPQPGWYAVRVAGAPPLPFAAPVTVPAP